ncbi:MAG: tyrosine-type recombinase/integrase [Ardenticatenales bacterium]|nr:tyrosine-type recombinase/integrase [Ardenticatenales bacterium]
MRRMMDSFLDYLENSVGYSPHTVAAYRNDLNQFASWLEAQSAENEGWDSLGEAEVASYLLFLREREYATATIARKIAAVKSFYKHLVEEELLDDNPTAHLTTPSVEKEAPITLSHDEIERLLAEPTRLSTSTKALRDRAMLELLYGTGLRVSELVNISLRDLDVSDWTLQCGEGSTQRTVPISQRAVDALQDYLEEAGARERLSHDEAEETLFLNMRGRQLTRQGLWLIIKNYVEQAAIQTPVTPHTLRHTYALHHYRDGSGRPEERIADLQRLLGHANSSTTQIYAQESI